MANQNQNLPKTVEVPKFGIQPEGTSYEWLGEVYGNGLTLGATKDAFKADLANFLNEHKLDSENFEVAFINEQKLIEGTIISRINMEDYPSWEEFKLLVSHIRIYELAPSSVPSVKFKRPYIQDYKPPSSSAKFAD